MSNYPNIREIIGNISILDLNLNKIEIKKLVSGKTNQSYLVKDDFKKYIIRLNSEKSNDYNIDRSRELKILKAIQEISIGPKIIYCDTEYNFLITEFIEGVLLLPNNISSLDKKNLNDLIMKYQKIEIILPKFNYFQHLKKYENFISQNLVINKKLLKKLNNFYPYLNDFQNQGWEPVLCHHDLISSNIIKSNNGLRIIDWEYSAYGHSNFDRCYSDFWEIKDSFFEEFFKILDEMWVMINKI